MKYLTKLFYPTTISTESEMKNSQNLLLVQTALAGILLSLGTGNFLAGYLATLGATPAQIAQIAAIPQLGCVLQIIAPLFFERLARRKLAVVSMCFIFRFSVGFTVFAPLLFSQKQSRLQFVFALYFVSFLVAGFVTPALNSWIMQVAPQKNRGQYFAVKDIIAIVSNAIVAFLMGIYVDLQSANDTPLIGYMAVYGFCIIASIVDVILMSRIREPINPAIPNIRLADLALPFREKKFRPLLVYELLGYTASMLSSGFMAAYQLTVLGLSHTFITSVGVVCSLVGMISIWIWGKVADRTYWTTVVLGTRIVSTICLFAWWCLPVSLAPFLAPLIMATNAAGSGAASMSGLNLMYASCPAKGKTTFLACSAAAASMIGYCAALLGSCIQQQLATTIGGRSMAMLFAVSGVISLIALVYGYMYLPKKPITYDSTP